MRFTLHILFYSIMLILFTILGFTLFRSGEIMPLKGYNEKVERPEFKMTDWFSGAYQSQMDKRTQSKFGFRSVFIRLKNQLDYSFFDEIHAQDVVEGKSGYLYAEIYIKAYKGEKFIGNEYDTIEKTISNYTFYRQQLLEQQVDFIDFNDWFLQIKDTSQYALYPKNGIHWSHYADCLVADSLLNYIEGYQKVDVPDIVWTGIQTKTKPKFRDNDLEESMNLLKNKTKCFNSGR